jgi:hypothetical protein
VNKRFTRTAAMAALVAGISAPAFAQNGENFLILSNQFDVIYGGLGAGGSQTAADGHGDFVHGEDMRGNSLTTLGDYGYRQIGWRESACVLGGPIPGLGIKFSNIAVIELDGVNPYGPGNVFNEPVCATPFACLTSAAAPYGTPAGSSASFALLGFPTVAGLPSSAVALVPNNGLVPSSNGGTATLLAVATATLPIASTGFCWGVQFNWLPSAVPSLDDVNGWWTWRQNSPDNNQYWGLSNDELNIGQSNTVFLDGGASGIIAFFGQLNYETHYSGPNPASNPALAPVGMNGTGPYYAIGAGVPNSGNSVNGGFDMGRHGGLSHTGTGGGVNVITGVGNQDPAGSPTAGLVPTIALATMNNSTSSLAGTTRFHLGWLQIATDLSFGIDPATTVDLGLGGPAKPVRVPVSNQVSSPVFPQPLTNTFFTLWRNGVDDQTGLGNLWPDPFGFGGGAFGIVPSWGATLHLPTTLASTVAFGFPAGLQVGTSQLGSLTGPLFWGPGNNDNAPSQSTLIALID